MSDDIQRRIDAEENEYWRLVSSEDMDTVYPMAFSVRDLSLLVGLLDSFEFLSVAAGHDKAMAQQASRIRDDIVRSVCG